MGGTPIAGFCLTMDNPIEVDDSVVYLKRSLGLFKWYFCQFGRTVSKTSRTISKCVQDHS